MNRRVAGFAVLLAAIMAALIAPAVGGRHLAGSARRIPTPDPPRVGECLSHVASQPSAMEFDRPVFAEHTQPCGDDNVGEIAAVLPKVYFSPPTLDNGASVAQAVNCAALEQNYLGWAAPEGAGATTAARSSSLVRWRPPGTLGSGLLGPEFVQYLDGQRWVACVVYPRFAPFRGSLRGALRDGQNAEAFASCRASGEVTAQPISCLQPHRTEILGVADDVSGPNPEVKSSCLALAHRVTGMSDLSRDGAVMVTAVVTAQESASTVRPGDPQQDQAICSSTVVGSRMLVGTLIGLGDKNLPWQ